MVYLFNVNWKIQNANFEILYFGPQAEGLLHYDYRTPFPVFLDALSAAGLRIDALLFLLPEVFELPPGIEHIAIPSFALLSDWNLNYVAAHISAQCFDRILVDRRGANLLTKLGYSNVLEFNMYGLHLVDVRIPERSSSQPIYDVAFVGNVSPCVQKERGRWLRRLMKLHDRIQIRLDTDLQGDAYYSALQSAKVVFNHSIRGEANMRVFECLAVGGLVFLEDENLEIRSILSPQTECILYPESSFEDVLLGLVADRDLIQNISATSQSKRCYWSAEGRWNALGLLLENTIHSGLIRNRNLLIQDALRLRLCSSYRQIPEEELFQDIDRQIGPSMPLDTIDLVFARFVMQGALPDSVFPILDSLYMALEQEGRNTVWNKIHYAGCLENSSEKVFSKELDVWMSLLDLLSHPTEEMLRGYPIYRMPNTRHSDLQHVLWNHTSPGAFSDAPSIVPYLKHWALHRIGEILMHLGDGVNALQAFRQSVRLYAGHAPTWIRMSECLGQESPEYRLALENAFDIDPMNPEIGIKLLIAREQCGDQTASAELAWELDGLLDFQCKVYKGSMERNMTLRNELNQIRARFC